MGIDGLNPFLEKKVIGCHSSVPLASLKGKRVAIDISIRLAAIRSRTYTTAVSRVNCITSAVNLEKYYETTINQIVAGVMLFESHGIIPVLVFDGVSPPEKKANGGVRRAAERKVEKDKLEAIQTQIGKIPVVTDRYVHHDALRKALKACWWDHFPHEIKEAHEPLIRDRLRSADIEILDAVGEADELCAALALEGKVDAVYSTDMDLIVRGCPLLITKVSSNDDRVMTASLVRYGPEMLESLGMSREQFVDMCILAQCDYNTGIAGIGIPTAYKLIKKYTTIEQYGAGEGVDISGLNAVRCRELFSPQPSETLIKK